MHLVSPVPQRQGHDGRADRDFLTASGPISGDLAAEFVTEHHLLIGAHEAVVAGLREELRLLVGVVASVQVGPADPTAPDVDQDLSLLRSGCRKVDDLKPRVLAGDRLHAQRRLTRRAGCRPMAEGA